MSGEISISGSDNEKRIEWKITDFFKTDGFIIWSRHFHLFMHRFELKVYPERNGYTCMDLETNANCDMLIEYLMGVKKVDGSYVIIEPLKVVVMNKDETPAFKLVSREELLRSRETMVPGDCLTVFCYVRYFSVTNCSIEKNLNPERSWISIKENKNESVTSNSSINEGEDVASSEASGMFGAVSLLTENLKELYLKKRCTDVTIKVKTKEFPAHRTILVARSDVFASMFEHDTSERRTGIIEITDCDPDSFEDFLLFLYTADLKIVSSKNVVGLFKTSDKYGCKKLSQECVLCMIHELSVDTFCDYFQITTLHDESDFVTAVVNFFIKNAQTIFSTAKWLALIKENPSLCNELFITASSAGKRLSKANCRLCNNCIKNGLYRILRNNCRN